ncbi:MAG TPA: STN domain-containing protein, partial [Rhizomicrobium sp.]|nr:STN domain-containing protein [Rhizomicrobium sp.]
MGGAKLKKAAWCSIAFTCVYANAATAQVRTISIPEQPLSQALRLIGQQTGLSILFKPSAVQGLRAHALFGQMTAQQALGDLLHGTGLVAVADGTGFLIQQAAQPVPDRTPPAHEPAPSSEKFSRPDPSRMVERVVVSPTRILSAGFSAPTPTTI